MPETALTPIDRRGDALVALGTLRATSADELVAAAAAIARPLADVIERQKLYSVLGGRKFVRVEGWTTCAALLGCTPHEVQVEAADGVYTATVELRRLADGQAVSRASAECGAADELDRHGQPMWANRPAYARRSMAITRATGKACRLAFSWIVTMAGYEATPAEEMTSADVVADVEAAERPARRPGPQSDDRGDARLISDKQAGRLVAIARDHGWTAAQLTAFLTTHGILKAEQVRRAEYEAICEQLAAGPSPAAIAGADREVESEPF